MARRAAAEEGVDLGMSSEAVERATGKGWEAWFAALDAAGGSEMAHKDIATLLHERNGVPAWWSQMVTVGYERARGKREVHQKSDGFSASISRTFAAPMEAAFDAFATPSARGPWLDCPEERFTVTKATPSKSLRIACGDGTRVEVNLYAKGPGKCQAQVQHNKLKSAADVEKAKAFWAGALDRLRERLGG